MTLSVERVLERSALLECISDTPALDVELLLAHALDVDRTWLKTWPEHKLELSQEEIFEGLFVRRLEGEPIAFIIGSQGFWTLDLKVTPETLIPRPETELLVEASLDLNIPKNCLALDLGTGTGAIALALASERPNWQLTAVDSQPSAVDLAKQNRQCCHIDNVTIPLVFSRASTRGAPLRPTSDSSDVSAAFEKSILRDLVSRLNRAISNQCILSI